MNGPPAILDKSAFQALSFAELTEFRRYFIENTTPVLILEVLGDLAKRYRDGTVPEDKVQELANKFGPGEFLNEEYKFICVNTLAGTVIPLTGQIVPAYMTVVDDKEGSAALVEEGPLNHLVRRLASGTPTERDRELASRWRSGSQGLSFSALNDFVNRKHIIIPRVGTAAEAAEAARGLADTGSLQDLWLQWLLEHLGIPNQTRARILVRWRLQGGMLRTFAEYAHYCLVALLSMFVAWRSNIVPWKPSNLLDLQYLYYMPFCMVFVSDDRLHRALAPALMRRDQTFVQMREFKAGLRHAHDYFERLSETERKEERAKLYDWPPKGSIVRELWLKNERWTGPPPPS